jgi:hypothetical protein
MVAWADDVQRLAKRVKDLEEKAMEPKEECNHTLDAAGTTIVVENADRGLSSCTVCRKVFGADGGVIGNPKSSDPVNHPSHYTSLPARCSACGHPIKCIDVAEHMGFSLGNALKYLWRAGKKGDLLEDLKKAAWYVNREIEKLARESKS